MNLYGLIGKSLTHSASKKYFTEKFHKESLQNSYYELFELTSIKEFPKLLKEHPNLQGLNVTIPYKEEVIKYLDELSPEAKNIGAVNTIKFSNNLIGYNTDAIAFLQTMQENVSYINDKSKALILGSGGASKAVAYALDQLNINYKIVSRNKVGGKYISYKDLTKNIILEYKLIVNSTPLGTYPNIYDAPEINYEYLNSSHFCYDLVYNPPESKFLCLARKQGAKIMNGDKMLIYQAEEAWKIWNK